MVINCYENTILFSYLDNLILLDFKIPSLVSYVIITYTLKCLHICKNIIHMHFTASCIGLAINTFN